MTLFKPSPCYHCDHSEYVPGFDQPVGCIIHDITFGQDAPQPIVCPDRIQTESE